MLHVFAGKSQRKELEAVRAMVMRLASDNRVGWDCPDDLPISECPVVQQWSELVNAIPFSAGATDIGTTLIFHN